MQDMFKGNVSMQDTHTQIMHVFMQDTSVP